jgi:ankyrin repeat protein
MVASEEGKYSIVQILVSHGADVNAEDPVSGTFDTV